MLMMQVSRVQECRCGAHAIAELRDPTGDERIRINIDSAAGRALAAELHGREDCFAGSVDVLRAALACAGAYLERLVLRYRDARLTGLLLLRCAGGVRAIPVDPCHGLLTACRLSLPILFDGAAPSPRDRHDTPQPAVPDVFRAFLESLDYEGLGGPAAPPA
jgi:hypothetical protein